MKDPGPYETDSERYPHGPSDVFFGVGRKTFSASAPGRLDVMGGIADYCGSMVLELPLEEATTARVALRDDGRFRVHSDSVARGEDREVEFQLPARFSYEALRKKLNKRTRWAAYVIGCAAVLIREKDAALRGADIWIESGLPAGKGVSASAALEVSVMTALSRALKLKLGGTELPTLCQRVENQVVGAPCGVMDQCTSYLGRANKLFPMLCQPARIGLPLDIPKDLHFVGIDSGAAHAVSGSAYTDARTAAFMGYEIIRRHLRRKRPFDGYLANIPVSVFEQDFMERLPDTMTGRSFFEYYRGTIDPETEVRSSRSYAVYAATRHPVYEHFRVTHFITLIETLNRAEHSPMAREGILRQLGELMYQSHASYSNIGLGHKKTDQLVAAAREYGPEYGVYGARVTGGGSGGTVCLLVDGERGLKAANDIGLDHATRPLLFMNSGDGARWRT